jgi:hypothetical protein
MRAIKKMLGNKREVMRRSTIAPTGERKKAPSNNFGRKILKYVNGGDTY